MQHLPLSIIMPVFNERETVATVAQRVLAEVPVALELIIVDDESRDGSAEITDALARNDPRILAIHTANGGKTSALKAGFERSRGEIKKIGFKDGLLALWYIVRFNLVCSINKSFREIPKLNVTETRNVRRAPASPVSANSKAHGVSG